MDEMIRPVELGLGEKRLNSSVVNLGKENGREKRIWAIGANQTTGLTKARHAQGRPRQATLVKIAG